MLGRRRGVRANHRPWLAGGIVVALLGALALLAPGPLAAPAAGQTAGQHRIFLAAAPRVAGLAPTYLADEFGDPASGWPVGDRDGVRSAYVGGEYLLAVERAGAFGAAPAPLRADRLTAQVRARLGFRYPFPTAFHPVYGIFFAGNDALSSYHALVVDPAAREALLLEVIAGESAVLIRRSQPEAIGEDRDATNRLAVVVDGRTVQAYVNGRLAFLWEGAALQGDRVGVVASELTGQDVVQARFDDFRVNDLLWTSRAEMPDHRDNAGAAVPSNGRLYILGGATGSGLVADVDEYNPPTDAWARRGVMPVPRSSLGVAAVGDRVYAIGGMHSAVVGALDRVDEYTPATNGWRERAPMPTARSELGVAAAPNGRLYAAGGYADGRALGVLEEYDPATDTWARKAEMPTARRRVALAAIGDRLYAFAGDPSSNTLEEYDPATDAWRTRAAAPFAFSAMQVVSAYGKLYAIGPCCDLFGTADRVLEYDPVTDGWSVRSGLLQPRAFAAAAAADGRIFVLGGTPQFGINLRTVEEGSLPVAP